MLFMVMGKILQSVPRQLDFRRFILDCSAVVKRPPRWQFTITLKQDYFVTAQVMAIATATTIVIVIVILIVHYYRHLLVVTTIVQGFILLLVVGRRFQRRHLFEQM